MPYVIDTNSAKKAKELKFMLWSFLDIKLDIPVEESLRLFGRHTTYRHNSNITKDHLDKMELHTPLFIEYIKLMVDNPYVDDKLIVEVYGSDIEIFFKSNWRTLLATTEPSEYGSSLLTYPGRYKPNSSIANYFRKVLEGVLKETPEDYYKVVASVFNFGDYESPALLIQHIAKYYNNRLLETIPLTKSLVEEMVEANLFRIPNIGSALIANGGLELIRDKVEYIEDWMSLGDVLNLGLELKELEQAPFIKHSPYALVKFLPSENNWTVLFCETSYQHYEYLSMFEPTIRLELISDLIKGDRVEVEHYFYTALALLSEPEVKVDEWFLTQLVTWAIDYKEPRNLWRLYFYDGLPDNLKKVVEPHLS